LSDVSGQVRWEPHAKSPLTIVVNIFVVNNIVESSESDDALSRRSGSAESSLPTDGLADYQDQTRPKTSELGLRKGFEGAGIRIGRQERVREGV